MGFVGTVLAVIPGASFALLTPSSTQIVDKDSAYLRLPNEQCVGVPGLSHGTMRELHNITSEGYTYFGGYLSPFRCCHLPSSTPD